MPRPDDRLVVLSYGLGADSTAILLRWLLEPSSRDFELDQLVVVTAMTGDEFAETGRLVTQHVLPLLRARGIRFIQTARSSFNSHRVLSDSTSPDRLHLEGDYRLSTELLQAGTVPQFHGSRTCSIHAKGWALDPVLRDVSRGRPFRHVIGFNAEELRRVEKDRDAFGSSKVVPNRVPWYPLVEWGWGRRRLLADIHDRLGVRWPKSCCVFCPFQGSTADKVAEELVLRFRQEPAAAAKALLIEHVALAQNPRQPLFPSGSTLRAAVRRHLPELEGRFEAYLAGLPRWALYQVRRAVVGTAHAPRSLQLLATGGRSEMEALLHREAQRRGAFVVEEAGSRRVWLRQRAPRVAWVGRRDPRLEISDDHPTTEELLVVAPHLMAAKDNDQFPLAWCRSVQADEQRVLHGEADPPEARVLAFMKDWLRAHRRRTFTRGELKAAARLACVTGEEADAALDRAWEVGCVQQGEGPGEARRTAVVTTGCDLEPLPLKRRRRGEEEGADLGDPGDVRVGFPWLGFGLGLGSLVVLLARRQLAGGGAR